MTALFRPGPAAPRTRSLRRGVAAAFFVVLAGLLVLVFARGRRSAPPPLIPDKAVSTPKVDERERVRYVEFRGGKEKIDFQADRSFSGPDGLYHMTGHVEIADFGREGGRKILASCDEIVHDAEKTRFQLLGRVKVQLEETAFSSDTLDYDREADAFSTDEPILISSAKMTGTARGMTYSLKTEEIWLRSEVRIETRVSDRSPLPLVIEAPNLYYSRPIRTGRMEGGVVFTHGRSRGSADGLEFVLFADKDLINTLDFNGRVKFHLEKEFEKKPGPSAAGPGEPPPPNAMLTLGEDQDVRADNVHLRAYLDSSKIHSYESKGNASLTFRSSTRGDTRFDAGSIDFIFEADGSLREFRAATNVRMKKVQPNGETQTAQGDSLLLPWRSDVLQIKPRKDGRVLSSFRGSRLETDVLGIDVKTDDMNSAAVTARFEPSPDKKPVGLFQADKPVYITARWMKYTAEAKAYRFYGGVKMWQDRSVLHAEDATLVEATGETTCVGAVRSSFPHTPKEPGAKEEIVEITGAKMHYDPGRNEALYEGQAGLTTAAFGLTADSIRVKLAEQTKDPQRMTALMKVVIKEPNREGHGEEALYLVEDKLLILTGKPVVTEKGKGETRGDKLTFHLADDTITVENTKRNRSVTKIKS
jgi:lipopolysaccharide transport protein LptA